MKRILLILLVFFFACLVVQDFGDQVAGYSTFATATQERTHIIGELVTDSTYTYSSATNTFTFYMRDANGDVRMVVYRNPKPMNFDDAERLVVDGIMFNDKFLAHNILVKCPSKYNDTV